MEKMIHATKTSTEMDGNPWSPPQQCTAPEEENWHWNGLWFFLSIFFYLIEVGPCPWGQSLSLEFQSFNNPAEKCFIKASWGISKGLMCLMFNVRKVVELCYLLYMYIFSFPFFSGFLFCLMTSLCLTVIDGSVVNVNIYLPATGQLYGIDWNKRAFLVSEDQGTTWMSVSSERYLWAKAQSGLLFAINVTWINDLTLSPSLGSPTSGFIDSSGKWGGNATFF